MPTEYIHFTEGQKQQARRTDLISLLQSQGEQLKRSGKEYVWRDGSEKITVRGNLWFHQYERIGGDAVDFVRRFYNMDFPQAVNFLLGNNGGTLQRAEPIKREQPKPFALPPKNENMRRVFAYLLNRRGIDREVLYDFVHKGMIYESADYHNAVFVGCDESGTPRHAHKRGTGSESSYKGNTESSDPRYSFHWTGRDNTLYLFEAPIDVLACPAPDTPVAFMGVAGQRLEMLFLLPRERGAGLGKQLLRYAMDNYGVREVTVNEQNPQAEGFYRHMDFSVYKRTDLDEAGDPYPLLYMRHP